MTKLEFQQRFEAALEVAVQNAEHGLRRTVSRQLHIRLYGADHAGDLLGKSDNGCALSGRGPFLPDY